MADKKKVDEKVVETEKVVENAKTTALKKFFKEQKIDCFEVQELKDEAETAIFRSRMEVKKQVLPFAILVDKSVYTLLQVQLAVGMDVEKLATLVNRLNNSYRMFKFNIADDGALLMNINFVAQDDKFDAVLLKAVLDEILMLLDKEYSNLMEEVWKLNK